MYSKFSVKANAQGFILFFTYFRTLLYAKHHQYRIAFSKSSIGTFHGRPSEVVANLLQLLLLGPKY
jgi:hypothetical protein